MQIEFPRVCIMVQIDMNIFNEEHSETPINKVNTLKQLQGAMLRTRPWQSTGNDVSNMTGQRQQVRETSINSC